MQQVYRYQRLPGYTRLAGPGQAGLERLEFGLLRVPRDEAFSFATAGQEAVLVILSGACQVEVDAERWTLERVSVFAEPAMAVYVPRHREYRVYGVKPADVAVATAEATQDLVPRLIDRHGVKAEAEGAGCFRRQVLGIVDQAFPASRLLVGETYVEPGQWASYPPHKHDEDRYPEEVRLEQACFVQIDPPQGFALQYVYSADRSLSQAQVVHNDDLVVVARGYHPLVAAPGYSLYYLWAMAGDGHVMRWSADPAHAWVGEEARAGRVAVPVE